MNIPSILPNQMSSLRPSKRKIVRPIYTTEKVIKNLQPELPKCTNGFTQALQDGCKNVRTRLTKS